MNITKVVKIRKKKSILETQTQTQLYLEMFPLNSYDQNEDGGGAITAQKNEVFH